MVLAVLGFQAEALGQEKIQYAPRLVVNITIDQLRTDYLKAFEPLYGADGFKRLLAQGLVYENASYPFSNIDRASAIASVITGVSPYYHSIIGGRWLDKESLRPVFCTDDTKQAGLDSPNQLLVSTLGDELKVATQGLSKIFAFAPQKDAAILSAGHAADGAFWLDTQSGQWKTSKYFLNEMPSWILSTNELRSPAANIKKVVWEPIMELSGTFNYYQHVGDQKPFRHTFKGERQFIAYQASGLVNSDITEMAQQCVTNHGVGYDRVTDLLCLTYYAGTFDHQSVSHYPVELQDAYVRLDHQLAELFMNVENRVGEGRALFVVTSTGYTDPEDPSDLSRYRVPTGTFSITRAQLLLNMYLIAVYGQGDYVETCMGNEIYLNLELIENKNLNLAEVLERSGDFLIQLSGVRDVYTSQRLALGAWTPGISKLRNAYNPKCSGDILVQVSPGWVLVNENTHEQTLSRESYVGFPLFFLGCNLPAEVVRTPASVDQVAPTLAQVMRIRAPNACNQPPLTGVQLQSKK